MKKCYLLMIVLVAIIASRYSYSMYVTMCDSNYNEDVIHRVLHYPMKHITARCQKDYHYTNDDMILLENELKKFLILAIVHKDSALGRGMYSRDVDNLWHTFLLFTKEYATFCRDHAGFFIHHAPEIEEPGSDGKLKEIQQDLLVFIEHYEKTFNEEINPIWLLDVYNLNVNTILGEAI